MGHTDAVYATLRPGPGCSLCGMPYRWKKMAAGWFLERAKAAGEDGGPQKPLPWPLPTAGQLWMASCAF